MQQPEKHKARRVGRPKSILGEEVSLTVRLTKTQRETFARMGGAPWLRSLLDNLHVQNNHTEK